MDRAGSKLVTDLGDLTVFLTRLVRLDRSVLVRLRRVDETRIAIWAWTPLDVLALRGVSGSLTIGDVTVRADALAEAARTVHESTTTPVAVELPPSQDLAWRGSLPPTGGTVLDTIPGDTLAQLLTAAEQTFREVSAVAAIPQRAGEALLEHVALTVTSDDGHTSADVSVRQLVAGARLGFFGQGSARVGTAGASWVFLAATHGVIYHRTGSTPMALR